MIFEERYSKAIVNIEKIEETGKKLTLEDYKTISKSLDEIIKSETTDPILKAYIEKSDKQNL